MSFDLGVWKANRPLSTKEADEIYGHLCEGELTIVEPSPVIDAFYTELTEQYPELNQCTEEELDKSPWSVQLDRSDRHIIMCISWSRADEVGSYVQHLAAKHELVCYDPQVPVVHYPPSLAKISHLRLQLENGTVIDNPSASTIKQALHSLTYDGNYFAILERTDSNYIQTATNKDGHFVIEYREGSADQHFQAEYVQLDAIVGAFQAYAHGDEVWKERFDWRKVEW